MNSCPQCSGTMESGLIGSAVWLPGMFENGEFNASVDKIKVPVFGMKISTSEDLRMYITAYRCIECGYLACYAKEFVCNPSKK